jgi:aspartyl-tRNA(Asn)/glutamyl-tRNA(Gln) amidotransferase subunit A
MDELAYLTLAEASERIRNQQLSPVDYTQALLGRSDDHDAKFNVYLRQTPDVALQHARQAEAELRAGKWRGPLHGIPIGLKDIIDLDGVPTTGRSATIPVW